MANTLAQSNFTKNELLTLLISEDGTMEDLGVKFHGESGTVHVI
jgi:hypothetical protein